MTAGSLQTRHLLPTAVIARPSSCGSAGDDGSDLDDVVVGQTCITGHERAVADDEVGFPAETQLLEEAIDRSRAGEPEDDTLIVVLEIGTCNPVQPQDASVD